MNQPARVQSLYTSNPLPQTPPINQQEGVNMHAEYFLLHLLLYLIQAVKLVVETPQLINPEQNEPTGEPELVEKDKALDMLSAEVEKLERNSSFLPPFYK